MINKEIIDKYDILFSSGAEFAMRVKLCHREEVEGASDAEIKAFCKEKNITLPAVLWSYTRHFGKKARARDSDYNCAYSLANYDAALHQASLREEWHEQQNMKELLSEKNFKVNFDEDYPTDNEGIYTPEIKSLMNINDIVPFAYDEYTRSFKFVDSSKENPYIYYLIRYYTLTSSFVSFSNRFRDILFLFIVNYAPNDFAEMGIVDGKSIPVAAPPQVDYSGGFESLRFYQEMFKSTTYNRGALKSLREAFYVQNDIVEANENRILSVNEFEDKFILFLKEKNFEY